MAFTTPRTWTTGEIVTSTMMNAHVRDNIRYLKGLDGSVAIESELSISAAQSRQLLFSNAGAAFNAHLGISSANVLALDVNRSPVSASFGDTTKSHARIALDGNAAASNIQLATANAANTTGTVRLHVAGDGKIGIGTTSPRGRLHLYDAISGFMCYEFDALAGSAQTLIADGTGDVLYAFLFASLVRSSGGTVQNLISFNAPTTPGGAASTIYSSGGDTVTLTVAANGSVTVVRAGGTLTYKVAILGIWL